MKSGVNLQSKLPNGIQPTAISKFGQLSHQNSANCHIKIQPTVTFIVKKWLNFKFNLYLCTQNSQEYGL